MNISKLENKKNVKIIAHRGLSGLECENSLAAFTAAGNRSYYGIETDVHTTRDKKFIIYHDDSTERLTDKSYVIGKTRFNKLRRLRMTDKFTKEKREDLFLPSLLEYLSICKKYEKTAILELKEEMEESSVLAIIEEVKKSEMLDHTVFISFSKNNLLILRRHYKNIPAQLLSYDISKDTVDFILKYNVDADISHKAVTREFIKIMHEKGRLVNVWTVNDINRAVQLIDLGVDMITTNILE